MKKVVNIIIIVGVVTLLLALGVKAATSIAANQVTYNDTTVEDQLDELVDAVHNIPEPVICTPGHYCTTSTSCPSGALCSKVSIGDYVSMTPTSTEYTISAGATGYIKDQTINPSELNLWRVISINNDGTIEMVSEYVSSTSVYFYGQKGYLNLVGTLNLIAKQYENSKYTIGSRHIGYNGQSQIISDISKFTTSAPWTTSTSSHGNTYETIGGGDIMYKYDTDSLTGIVKTSLGTLKANNISGKATEYWLSSRNYSYSSSSHRWGFHNVDIGGNVYGSVLYYYNGRWIANPYNRAIRPIVTLRSDITSFTGSGTSDLPWVLS